MWLLVGDVCGRVCTVTCKRKRRGDSECLLNESNNKANPEFPFESYFCPFPPGFGETAKHQQSA